MNRNLLVYLAIIVGTLAIALDISSVDLALPAMERQFGLSFDGVQWVINGYILAFSVLMVAGGRFADACGRRRVFLFGMGLFAIASLLGGAAWSAGSLIALRVIQGVGAAVLWPAMIGMACAAVGDARRSVAMGLIFGTCSVGNAIGPVVGGALTQWLSWRWVLWINVPLAVCAILIALCAIPRDPAMGERPRNDYPGMVTLTGGLVALMLVAYQGQSWGWADAKTLGLIALTVILLGAFPVIERRAGVPLIPLELLRSGEFVTLCLCVTSICQVFFVVMLYFTQYAMKFLGDDPMWAGARVVQFMLSYGVVSYFGGPLGARFGTRRLLVWGVGCAAVASIALAFFGPGASPLPFNAFLILLGMAVGAVIPTASARAIETAGTERASLASGVTFMCQLSGSALMLAVNTLIFTAVSMKLAGMFIADREEAVPSPSQLEVIRHVLEGPKILHALPPHRVADISGFSEIVARAYQDGLATVLLLGAVILIFTLMMVLRFVPKSVAQPARS